MNKSICIALLASLAAFPAMAERPFAIGVVSFAGTKQLKADLYHRSFTVPAYDKLKSMGLSPQWVKPDIFFQINRETRDQYKRLYIPYGVYAFPLEAFEGMADYARNGGLLITNAPLCYVDRNEDERFEPATGDYPLGAEGELVSIFGASPGRVTGFSTAIAEVKGPISAGMTLGEAVPLKASGNIARNVKGVVHVSGMARVSATGKHFPAPLVIVTRSGRGSCVYVTFKFWENLGTFPADKLFENICGEAALSAFVYSNDKK